MSMTHHDTSLLITSVLNAGDTLMIEWLIAGSRIVWQTRLDLLGAPHRTPAVHGRHGCHTQPSSQQRQSETQRGRRKAMPS